MPGPHPVPPGLSKTVKPRPCCNDDANLEVEGTPRSRVGYLNLTDGKTGMPLKDKDGKPRRRKMNMLAGCWKCKVCGARHHISMPEQRGFVAEGDEAASG